MPSFVIWTILREKFVYLHQSGKLLVNKQLYLSMAANKSYQSCQVATNPDRLPQQVPLHASQWARNGYEPSTRCKTFVTRSIVNSEDYVARIWTHKGNEGPAQYTESSSTYIFQQEYRPPLFIYNTCNSTLNPTAPKHSGSSKHTT